MAPLSITAAAATATATTSTPFLPQAKPQLTTSSFQGRRVSIGHGLCGGYRWSCRKEGVHPEFHEDAKVYCNGELVMTTGGTQKEYNVDVWSGNHPFYLGNRSALLVDADQVEKFRKKYGQIGSIMEIPVLKYGEIVLPSKKKAGTGKGGKKK